MANKRRIKAEKEGKEEKLYSVREIAEMLSISIPYAYRLLEQGTKNGTLKTVHIGRLIRLPESELKKLLSQRVQSKRLKPLEKYIQDVDLGELVKVQEQVKELIEKSKDFRQLIENFGYLDELRERLEDFRKLAEKLEDLGELAKLQEQVKKLIGELRSIQKFSEELKLIRECAKEYPKWLDVKKEAKEEDKGRTR